MNLSATAQSTAVFNRKNSAKGMNVSPVDTTPVVEKSHTKAIFLAALICAAISAIIYIFALFAGEQISHAEHSDNTRSQNFRIAEDTITLPANLVRYPSQRNTQIPERLDLYLHWPSMAGFSEALSEKFNNLEDRSKIIFATIEPRFSQYDMSARFFPIYTKFIERIAVEENEFGLQKFTMDAAAGFIDEILFVEKNKADPTSPTDPYVVRCSKTTGKPTIPYCIRDFHIAKSLVLTYRFHRSLLAQWHQIEQAMQSKFNRATR